MDENASDQRQEGEIKLSEGMRVERAALRDDREAQSALHTSRVHLREFPLSLNQSPLPSNRRNSTITPLSH